MTILTDCAMTRVGFKQVLLLNLRMYYYGIHCSHVDETHGGG